MQNTNPPNDNPTGRLNKRAYQRYVVNLKGQCCQGQTCSQIEIRDFCHGGMHVVYTPTASVMENLVLVPAHGAIITIIFSLPSAPTEMLQAQGRIVRSDLVSLGIAFVQPNYLVLERLMAYARYYQEQKVPFISPDKQQDTAAYEGVAYDVLLKNVRTMTTKPIRTLIDSYLLKQPSVLMEMADKATNITAQNGYFSAIKTFKQQGKTFRTAFLNGMHQVVFSKPANIDQTPGTQEDKLTSETLALVDDDALDDWIARSDISNKAESSYLEELAGIEQRLSLLLGMRIWKQNNPVGPEAFSRIFQDALKGLDISRDTYLLCCKVFRDILINDLGALYQTVNQYLVKHGVLPALQYEIKVEKDTGKPRRRNKPKADIDSAKKFLDALDGSDDGKNLYDLITTLQSIKRGDVDDSHSDRPTISTQKLLGKLSELSRQATSTEVTKTGNGELSSLSLQLLAQLAGGESEYRLDPREAAIMETTGSIYDALYNDEIITSGVKQWLSKIELSLLHEAIRDESVLADKGHVARTFINQLAKLELYNDDGRDYISNSIRRTIEGLLKQVASQSGMDSQLMSSLLKKINALVELQSKAYNDNFSETLERCETQAELPALKLKLSPATLPVPNGFQLQKWRKCIRRIHIGDWILFDAGSRKSTRLKLAWVTDNHDQYVFVNMLGLLEGAISIDHLARLLESDNALFLENVDEPAVDRAQYSMLHKLHSQLMHETTHDQLTALLNRREFEKQMKGELLDNSAAAESNTVCIFDIDYFEIINTTFGYDAGDQLLIEIADFIKQFFSSFSVLGRVGGNEFAVLLTGCSMQQAITIVEKQKDQLSNYRFKFEESSTLVTLSAGIVPINLQQQDVTRLLQTAEAACRLAKSKGLNCMHVVDENDKHIQETKQLMAWASKIDDCLANDNLILRYQPITPIGNDVMEHHSEILLGVTNEDGSLVSPEPFILAAEKYRRMPEIDRWVVKNVFSYLNNNPHVVDTIGGVAVNLSGLSINDESFIPFILEQIALLEISTDYITFEITETAGIESLSSAAEFINTIKKTGCRFSLDDFGTGMSTYSYLKNLPVDFIKIDGSFIRDLETNNSDKAVVRSITEIGHFMGKKIIAECVEKESTIDLLRGMGVDYVQGYAIARPKPLKNLLTESG